MTEAASILSTDSAETALTEGAGFPEPLQAGGRAVF